MSRKTLQGNLLDNLPRIIQGLGLKWPGCKFRGSSGERPFVTQNAPAAFFSYCREDSDFALQLAGDLKAAGASVWLDQLDIVPGQRWDRAVEDALARCPRMLIILSPASVDSTNVMDEVSFALEEKKTVIPIICKDCVVPFRLRRVQYVDFRKDYARGLKELLKTLNPDQSTSAISDAPRQYQTDTMGAGKVERAAEEEREKAEAQRAREEAEAREKADAERKVREEAEEARRNAEARRAEIREKAQAGRKAKEAEEARQKAEAQNVQLEADAVATREVASEVPNNSIMRAVALPTSLAAAAFGISFVVSMAIYDPHLPPNVQARNWISTLPWLMLTFVPIGSGGCWTAYRLSGRKVPNRNLVVLGGAWVISFVAYWIFFWRAAMAAPARNIECIKLAALASVAGFFVGWLHKRIEPSLKGKHLFAIVGVWTVSWPLAWAGYASLHQYTWWSFYLSLFASAAFAAASSTGIVFWCLRNAQAKSRPPNSPDH